MSHAIEIDQTTGLANFVAAREEAWHRLGDFQADRLLTIAEAGDRAHLTGWDVRLVPVGGLVDPSDPLSWQVVEGKRQPVRTNPHTGEPEVLGREQVGPNYQVWQNEATLEFAQQIAGVFGDEQIVSAAGSMMGGTRIFACLSLEGFTVLGEDAHSQWLTVMNGHDGTLNLTGLTGATRVVCRNTADWALQETTNVVRIRHSGNMAAKVEEAAHALEVARNWATAYGKMAEDLARQSMTEKAFQKMIGKAYDLEPSATDGNRTKARKARDLEALTWNYMVSPTTEIGRGTKWGALNAITEWAEHGRPGDQTTEKAATLNLFGTPALARAKAVKILTGAKA